MPSSAALNEDLDRARRVAEDPERSQADRDIARAYAGAIERSISILTGRLIVALGALSVVAQFLPRTL
jgi:hypothetical protein